MPDPLDLIVTSSDGLVTHPKRRSGGTWPARLHVTCTDGDFYPVDLYLAKITNHGRQRPERKFQPPIQSGTSTALTLRLRSNTFNCYAGSEDGDTPVVVVTRPA